MIGCEHIRIETAQSAPVVWELSHVDHRGRRHMLAEFTNGPFQRRLLMDAARLAAQHKMIEVIEIAGPDEDTAKLIEVYDGVHVDYDWGDNLVDVANRIG